MEHELSEHELIGGGRALVIHAPGAKVAVAKAYFRSGFCFADKNKFETPHLMEHLMLSGNKLFPSAMQFKVETEKNGAYRNAATGPYMNAYDYRCAQYELDRILGLMAAQLSSPLFPEASFVGEKGNVSEELRRNTSNYERRSDLLIRNLVIANGSQLDEKRLEQLPNITRDDVVSHYQNTHLKANLRLILAGDFSDGPDELLQKFMSGIEQLPTGKRLAIPDEPAWEQNQPLVEVHPIKQIYYTFYVSPGEPLSFGDQVKADVLRRLFRGRYDSWFYGEARERGLAYEVGTSLLINPFSTDLITQAHVGRDSAEELFKIFANGWRRALNGEFSENDVDEVKDYTRGFCTRVYDSTMNLVAWHNQTYAINDRLQPLNEYLDRVAQVTKQDVVEIAQKLVSNKKWALSLVGNVDQKLADQLYKTLQPIFD